MTHFYLYIRRQVQKFSAGVSADMVSQEIFFTIPDLDISDDADPRTRNYQSFANQVETQKASVVNSKLYNALKDAADIEDNRAKTQVQ